MLAHVSTYRLNIIEFQSSKKIKMLTLLGVNMDAWLKVDVQRQPDASIFDSGCEGIEN